MVALVTDQLLRSRYVNITLH